MLTLSTPTNDRELRKQHRIRIASPNGDETGGWVRPWGSPMQRQSVPIVHTPYIFLQSFKYL